MTQAGRWLVGALLPFAAFIASPGAYAQKILLVGAPPMPFKFSEIRTRDDADSRVAMGSLVKIYLFPTDLGGNDDSRNIVYVTPDAAEAHAAIVARLRRFVHGHGQGHGETEIEILPDYKGASIVPARIRFRARRSNGGEQFEEEVKVWQ